MSTARISKECKCTPYFEVIGHAIKALFLPIWDKRDFAGASPARDIIEGQCIGFKCRNTDFQYRGI